MKVGQKILWTIGLVRPGQFLSGAVHGGRLSSPGKLSFHLQPIELDETEYVRAEVRTDGIRAKADSYLSICQTERSSTCDAGGPCQTAACPCSPLGILADVKAQTFGVARPARLLIIRQSGGYAAGEVVATDPHSLKIGKVVQYFR